VTGSEFVTTGELHIAPESIEAVAQRVAELVAAATAEPASRPERITAEEVSRWWGVSRRWVYDHAEELGARRLGSGRRPRLRFDPDEVAERLGPPEGHGGDNPYMRGSRRLPGITNPARFMRRAELLSLSEIKEGRGGCSEHPPDQAPNMAARHQG
jgi:hypothetical protein